MSSSVLEIVDSKNTPFKFGYLFIRKIYGDILFTIFYIKYDQINDLQ